MHDCPLLATQWNYTLSNCRQSQLTEVVLVPDRCDGGPLVLFGAAGLRAADAGVTLPFQGVAAVLVKALDAGEV